MTTGYSFFLFALWTAYARTSSFRSKAARTPSDSSVVIVRRARDGSRHVDNAARLFRGIRRPVLPLSPAALLHCNSSSRRSRTR